MKDSGAWCAAFHGVAKSWTQVSNWTPPPRNEQLCANNVYNLDEMKKAWGWENGWGWSKGTNLLYKINKSGGYNIHPGDYSYDIV